MDEREPTRGGRTPRRRLLKYFGAGALAAGLAGCGATQETVGESIDRASGEATAARTDSAATGNDGGSPSRTSTTDRTSVDAVGSCALSLPADATETTFAGTVTADTTVGADADVVRVTDHVVVADGATLTVAPGTMLVFTQGVGLSVGPGSALLAEGTCQAPIVFTGEQTTRGFWRGIAFDQSDSTDNLLAHCVVEYAGSKAASRADAEANLAATRGSRLRITNTLLHESGGYGVLVDAETTLDAFEENVLTKNEQGAAHAFATSAGQLSATSTYAGNDEDRVRVVGNEVPEDDEVTWPEIDVEYVVDGTVDLNGHLTVGIGNTLAFTQDSGIEVTGRSGSLTAIGIDSETEESRPITFTGEQQTRGYWAGIYIDTADRVPSRFENVVVEYAGSREFYRAAVPAGVALTRGARASFADSTLRENAGYAFHFGTDVTVDAFVNNTVTKNEDGAGHVVASTAHWLSDTSAFAGNDDDRVYVDGDTIPEDADVTWDSLDARYYVADLVDLDGHLRIEPGATLSFGQDSGIAAKGGTGSLTAVGIVADTEEVRPITFTGEQQTRGFWRGLYFDQTDSVDNNLRYCTIEYAGAGEFYRADVPAGVQITRGARVRLANVTLRENAGYGLQATGDATLDGAVQNTVTRNESGACYVDASEAAYLSDTSTYAGNDTDRVYVAGDDVSAGADVTWEALDVPYYVADRVTVDGHVTVDPGATLAFGQDAGLWMSEDTSALTAVGTSDEPITFTGAQQTRGYWRGLYFDTTGDAGNELDHCVVEYGGSTDFYRAPKAGDVAVTRGARLSLSNCTLRRSGGFGLVAESNARVSGSGTEYAENVLGPTYQFG